MKSNSPLLKKEQGAGGEVKARNNKQNNPPLLKKGAGAGGEVKHMATEQLLFYTKMNFGVAANGGIKKKVFGQARAFRAHGLATDVLYVENKTIKIEGDTAHISEFVPQKWAYLRFLFGGFLATINVEKYNYLYIRHFLTNPLFLLMLYRIKKQNPALKIFIEIPTYPYQYELADQPFGQKMALWLDQRCSVFFKYFVSKIITFSNESIIFDIPTIQTDNGIDVSQFKVLHKAPYQQTLHLLGLANVQSWHGYDRIIEGMKLNTNFRVVFHVVGGGDAIPQLKKLTHQHNLEESVLFYGYQSGEQLQKIIEKCHLGVGACGMHRKNCVNTTSALKSVEYAVQGLPFVSGQDRAFPSDSPFVFLIPEDETPINLVALGQFYQNLRQQIPDYPAQMHQFVVQHLTWGIKLKKVVSQFRAS